MGAVIALTFVFNADQTIINRLLAFVFVLIYSFILTSGLLFIHRPDKTTLLKVALALQVFWVSLPFLTYHLASASYFVVRFGGMDVDRIGFSFNYYLGSTFIINFSGEHWNIGINLFAAALLYLLEKADRVEKNTLAASELPILDSTAPSDVMAS